MWVKGVTMPEHVCTYHVAVLQDDEGYYQECRGHCENKLRLSPQEGEAKILALRRRNMPSSTREQWKRWEELNHV